MKLLKKNCQCSERRSEEFEIELDEVLAVLHRIQQFDPIGVGYSDLAECLLIQLSQYDNPEQAKYIQNAKLIIKEHLHLLGHRDYVQLMRRTKLKEAELSETISLIENLDPRPGANISPPSTSYIVPDVIVSKQTETGKWRVELNPDTTPKIRINNNYASLVRELTRIKREIIYEIICRKHVCSSRVYKVAMKH